MAQGSTGFSKEEIDALMEVLDMGIGFDIQGPLGRAYRKLYAVQQRLKAAEEWKATRGW
jgi:hypothetical protein